MSIDKRINDIFNSTEYKELYLLGDGNIFYPVNKDDAYFYANKFKLSIEKVSKNKEADLTADFIPDEISKEIGDVKSSKKKNK